MTINEAQMKYLEKLFFELRSKQVDVDLQPLYDIVQRIDISKIRAIAGRKGGLAKANKQQALTNHKQVEAKAKQIKAKEQQVKLADFVTMSESDHAKFVAEVGAAYAKECIDALNAYKGSTGKTYKNDYMAMQSWVIPKILKNHGLTKEQLNARRSIVKAQPAQEAKEYEPVKFR